MDALLDFALLKQLDPKEAAAALLTSGPLSHAPTQGLDINQAAALVQLLKMQQPRAANTFPSDLSAFANNDPTLLLLNSLLNNPLGSLTQSLLTAPSASSTTSSSTSNADTQPPPAKRPCVERVEKPALASASLLPISPSHTASTSSSCGASASSTQNSPIPWPPLAGTASQPQQPSKQEHQLDSPRKSKRKPPEPIPDEKKDEAYYERRKKNNDAAKRSRDARRFKEEQTARRADELEQENVQLRNEVETLKSEVTKLRVLLLASPLQTTNSALAKPQPLPLGASVDVSVKEEAASSSSE